MPRVALDLNTNEGRQTVKGQWKVAEGYVPGEPNEGLTSQVLETPARLSDYDDSGWRVCEDVRESLSIGFTFAWYRIPVEVPDSGGVSTPLGSSSKPTSTTTARSGSMASTGPPAPSLASTPPTGWKSMKTHRLETNI